MKRKVIILTVLLFLLIVAGKATLAQQIKENQPKIEGVDPVLAAEMLAAGVPQNLIAETAVEWPAHLEEVARREAVRQERLENGEPFDESKMFVPNDSSAVERQALLDLEMELLNETLANGILTNEEGNILFDETAVAPPEPKAPGALLTVGSSCTYPNLQAALSVANDGDTIRMEQGIWSGDSNGKVTVADSVNIYGGYNFNCTSQMGTDTVLSGVGGTAGSVMSISANKTVGLYDMQLINGDATGMLGGGLLINDGSDVTLWSSVVGNNNALNGGGIALVNATLHLDQITEIFGNAAVADGGGIHCSSGGLVELLNVKIGVSGGNSAGFNGGGVYLNNCDLTYEYQTYNPIEGNGANAGGGIYANNGSSVTIHTVNNAGPKWNTATVNGGGIMLANNSVLTAHGAILTDNSAGGGGGGLFVGSDSKAYFPNDLCLVPECGQSKMERNSADYGGAIYVDVSGYLNTTGLVLRENSADVQGSALFVGGGARTENLVVSDGVDYGDHIIHIASSGALNIRYSTIYNNTDDGGGTAVFGLNPGGLIEGRGIITWNNYGTFNDVGGGTVDIDNSLLQFAPSGGSGNLIGQDPLFDFGTSYRLTPESPAVDYVTSPALDSVMFDIDNETRPNFGSTAYDAGADELYQLIGINGTECQYSSIADAVVAASNTDTIYIMGGSYNERIGTIDKYLTFVPAINDCTTIDLAATSDTVIIDGSGAGTILGGIAHVTNSATATFRHMTLQNGNATFGGALYVNDSGFIVLDDVDIKGNAATTFGGGIRLNSGTLYMQNGSRIIDNSATGGGGVAVLDGVVTMVDTSRVGDFNLGNAAIEDGGGIYLENSELSMSGTARVRSNTALSDGGGIYANGTSTIEMAGQSSIGWSSSPGGNEGLVGAGAYLTGTAAITATENSRIQYNATIDAPGNEYGGGIAAFGDSAILLDGDVIVQNNNALDSGGGIFLYADGGEPTLTMKNGATINNNSSDFGGGIYARGKALVTLDNVSITGNQAVLSGGGIRFYEEVQGELTQATITSNEAGNGGGIALNGFAFPSIPQISITDSVIESNTAVNGGGIYNYDGLLSIYGDCSISNNPASASGGGIYSEGNLVPSLPFYLHPGEQHCLIAGNTAVNGAGIYTVNISMSAWGNIEVNGNIASGNGGGLYAFGKTSWIHDLNDYRPSFLLNSATSGSGGGLYLSNVTDPNNRFFDGVDIKGNTAGGEGGGVYAENSTFSMRNNIVQGNYAGVNGGGLVARNNSNVTITTDLNPAALANKKAPQATDCDPVGLPADRYCSEFVGNSTAVTGSGGAIYMDSGSDVTVSDTAFMANNANNGAAIYSEGGAGALTVENGRFTNNIANSNSILRILGSDITMSASTIGGNTGTAVSIPNMATNVNFTVNVVWGNSDGIISTAPIGGGGCSISQNGVGGTMVDPLFTTTARGDYHLGAGSPAIDACIGGLSSDLDNVARPKNGLYDMGAFEACGVASIGISFVGPDVMLDWSDPNQQTVYQSIQPYQLGGSTGNYIDGYTHFGGALVGGTAYYYYVGCASTPQVGAFNFTVVPGN